MVSIILPFYSSVEVGEKQNMLTEEEKKKMDSMIDELIKTKDLESAKAKCDELIRKISNWD
jgi:hypothetical protein